MVWLWRCDYHSGSWNVSPSPGLSHKTNNLHVCDKDLLHSPGPLWIMGRIRFCRRAKNMSSAQKEKIDSCSGLSQICMSNVGKVPMVTCSAWCWLDIAAVFSTTYSKPGSHLWSKHKDVHTEKFMKQVQTQEFPPPFSCVCICACLCLASHISVWTSLSLHLHLRLHCEPGFSIFLTPPVWQGLLYISLPWLTQSNRCMGRVWGLVAELSGLPAMEQNSLWRPVYPTSTKQCSC